MRSAMITIEVLISMLILFMVIATSTATIKQLKIVRDQQVNHEELYMLVLNVKDYIDDEICKEKFSMEGMFNTFHYQATCTEENELKNYVKAVEEGDEEGNIGAVMIYFYKIILEVNNDKVEKKYIYFKTVIK